MKTFKLFSIATVVSLSSMTFLLMQLKKQKQCLTARLLHLIMIEGNPVQTVLRLQRVKSSLAFMTTAS